MKEIDETDESAIKKVRIRDYCLTHLDKQELFGLLYRYRWFTRDDWAKYMNKCPESILLLLEIWYHLYMSHVIEFNFDNKTHYGGECERCKKDE